MVDFGGGGLSFAACCEVKLFTPRCSSSPISGHPSCSPQQALHATPATHTTIAVPAHKLTACTRVILVAARVQCGSSYHASDCMPTCTYHHAHLLCCAGAASTGKTDSSATSIDSAIAKVRTGSVLSGSIVVNRKVAAARVADTLLGASVPDTRLLLNFCC
jgi:hypothetical protein